MTTESPAPQLTDRLPAGQAQLLLLSAGTHLHLEQGQLVLTPPVGWLAELCAPPPLTLRQGDNHGVPETGWYRLQAVAGPAAWRCHAPSFASSPARAGWQAPLVAVWQRLQAWRPVRAAASGVR